MAQMLTIWGEYTLPLTDGTLGQLLVTDGSGLVSWVSVSNLNISTSDVSEGTRLYYTDERVDDRVALLIKNGTGISWVYNDLLNTLTPTVTLAPFTTTNLAEGTNLYYTDERVDDRISLLIKNGTGITWAYDDVLNTLTPTVTLASFTTTNLAEGTNLYYTDERVDDRVALLIKNGTGISWSYNDALNTLTPTVTLAPFTTTDLAEGTNLYFTDERVDDRVALLIKDSATVTWSYNDLLGTLTANSTGLPLSVNKNGSLVGTRGTIDFVEGTNIALSVSDDTINNKIIVQVDASGSAQIIDILHSDLVAIQASSGLTTGAYYRITDFQTIYDQPDYDAGGNMIMTPLVKFESISPIIVKAIGSAELAESAYQAEYPSDSIKYELLYTTPVTNTATKGRIVERIDDRGNKTTYDHRTVLFKRYKNSTTGLFSSYFDTGDVFTQFPTFNNANSNSCVIENNFQSPDRRYNFDLPNVVLIGESYNFKVLGSIENLTITGTATSSTITHRATDTLIKGYISNSNINNLADTTIKGNIVYWTVLSALQTSTFSFSQTATSNHFGSIDGNTITAYNFSYNNITKFTNNLISNNKNITYNKILDLANTQIECDFNFNTFDKFHLNFILGSDGSFDRNNGVEFTENHTDYMCLDNDFGKKFNGNTLESFFGVDDLLDAGGGNTFSYGAIGTVFGQRFFGNMIESSFDSCTVGDDFRYNNIKYPISAIDFTAATHVYANYNTKIFKTTANTLRLSYYDEYDSRQTVNITD